MIDVLIGIGILSFLGGIFLLWVFRTRYLDEKTVQIFQKKIEQTRAYDPSHAILESHKLFVLALKNLGGQNLPAAKIIARHQKRFSDIKKIWEIHRLRNLLAHEIGIQVTEKDSERARRIFMKSLKDVTKR